MGIKRGVSLYSYQQSEFFHIMNWKDQLREVATNLGGATGIEIINEATIRDYPFPSESFYFDWNNEMARWGLTAVTMDTYLDTLQFRDHVMNHAETAERIKYDLRIAKKMGFQNMRLVHNVPFESIEMALPLAEELDIRITNEIHAPAHIKPKMRGKIMFVGSDWSYRAAADVAFIKRTGTKHYGLQPDFGIFQHSPSRVQLEYSLREFLDEKAAAKAADDLLTRWSKVDANDKAEKADFDNYVLITYPDLTNTMFYEALFSGMTAQPEDLLEIAPYIYCVHGKFYKMSEIDGRPGQ